VTLRLPVIAGSRLPERALEDHTAHYQVVLPQGDMKNKRGQGNLGGQTRHCEQ
ncbi:Hypothetical predicted protein, partial [Marmota monax]